MKNKAQEALDELYIQTNKEIVYQDEINGYTDTLQSLIDCQLTVEEISMIMNCLSVACFNSKTYNSIFEKLKQQKEMWEE